ncbi:unnamed protein product [Didymodactylos carnosus]|uniref:B box-type domain-containing protein n=1 Tax=Didymodactylos carnosus TaxID=1234261 RepID=A0A813VK20_9BILA|nr:unnamed protein product [Didymodactylos carnosus]CAF0838578.1 unnamed protein product [Didymodactylos carnosus]CAF3535217.1 unnamed protein product [Didymodactylos carnosus]CAF3625739.1 unnamed protein product [Didymodactylos carnosus]
MPFNMPVLYGKMNAYWEPFKDPKCLSCLHTFCEQCIENHVSAQRSYKYTDYREFACPICRKKTAIPTGGVHKLPDNFLIAGLSEMLSTHQSIKVTQDHSIYELEIEKDILCKHHLTEFVRFYCERCECCICIACTYSEHRDHELSDFHSAAASHKKYIQECLDQCTSKMNDLSDYLHIIKRCDSNISTIEASIHTLAATFEKSLRVKEQELVAQISSLYGDDTHDFIKRREELDEYFEQVKNTCSLTELVVNGKDIELLLVKKQLVEKFRELETVELEPLPENINMRVRFRPGKLDLGKLMMCSRTPSDDDEQEGLLDDEEIVENGEIEQEEDVNENEMLAEAEKHKATAIDDTPTQYNVLTSAEGGVQVEENELEKLKSFCDSSTQTDNVVTEKTVLETCEQAIQTINDGIVFDGNKILIIPPVSDENGQVDVSANTYEQSNKLSRRVRRLLKPTCSVAVLPNTDVIILDCEQNLASILDKRGKFKYCFSPEPNLDRKSLAVAGFSSVAQVSSERSKVVRIPTPQGLLCIKLKGERVSDLPLGFTVHAFNSISEADN